jgi:hypothetical protein
LVTELHRTMGYIGTLSIEDVLKSVLLATLKDSPYSSLRTAYHKVLDALDDDKDLTFALIQENCASEIRRSTRDTDECHPTSRGRDLRDRPGTPRRHPDPLGVARPALTNPRPQPDRLRPDGAMVTYLCNLLDDNDEKPWRLVWSPRLRLIGTPLMKSSLCTRLLSVTCLQPLMTVRRQMLLTRSLRTMTLMLIKFSFFLYLFFVGRVQGLFSCFLFLFTFS